MNIKTRQTVFIAWILVVTAAAAAAAAIYTIVSAAQLEGKITALNEITEAKANTLVESSYKCNETWTDIFYGMKIGATPEAREDAYKAMNTYHQFCYQHLQD